MMRYESVVLSVSWIPSEAVTGMPGLPFNMGLVHYDEPPPDSMLDFEELLATDKFRFANELRAWIEVEDERIVDCGYSGCGHINVSTVRLGRKEVTFTAISLPDIQRGPQVASDSVTFVQSAGGRTGIPAPRHVARKPFVQIAAPLAWTTLGLTIDKDGTSRGRVIGASAFPRHWIYDDAMHLMAKTGSLDFESWYRKAFGKSTPWGDTDSPAFVTEVETTLERELSRRIMRQGRKTGRVRLGVGETLVEQGKKGDSVFLLLDGVLSVEVDGDRVTEVGPGAILGERAVVEGGIRTSTLRALVPCRVAVAAAEDLDPAVLHEISKGHRREEAQS
jgi:hypothetical protein